MMKSEFENLIDNHVSDDEFKVIETVYNYYDEKLDKYIVANMYIVMGIKVFNDMLTRALRIKKLTEDIRSLVDCKRLILSGESAEDKIVLQEEV